ncbi:MAG TPA: hypothetical protein VFS58_02725 [Steroidobacteraceae bacterium]|nr:hypothetical protein [Steroidobacteraceae bacterium]
MRRITLILSDLYLPAEFGRPAAGPVASFPSTLDMPNFDWLLRFAERVERIEDWRSWLSADLGAFDLARMSVAQCCALRTLPAASSRNAWLATPVHLEARIDHVRLADRGLLRLSAQERDSWRQDFSLAFGPEYALHDAGERGFLLSGAAPARVASVDPSRLLDADIGQALPTGPSAGELRRLGTEIEMWLHGAPANVAREHLRSRRVSALWLWGGGSLGDGATETAPTADVTESRKPQVFGGDPFLTALAGISVDPAPRSFSELDAGGKHIVVELAPMSGATSEALAELETHWFAPARAALNSGNADAIDVVANDRRFRVGRRPGWRLWRRRASWLTRLAL